MIKSLQDSVVKSYGDNKLDLIKDYPFIIPHVKLNSTKAMKDHIINTGLVNLDDVNRISVSDEDLTDFLTKNVSEEQILLFMIRNNVSSTNTHRYSFNTFLNMRDEKCQIKMIKSFPSLYKFYVEV